MLLIVFLLMATVATIVLKPRWNKYIIIASSVLVWFFSTFHTRLDFKIELLESVEFYIFAVWVIICFKDKIIRRIIYAALALFTWFITDLITYSVFSLGLGVKNYFEWFYVCVFYFFIAFFIMTAITIIWLKADSEKVSNTLFVNSSAFLTIIYAQIIILSVIFLILFERDNNMALISKLSVIAATLFGFVFLDIMSFVFTRNNRKLERIKAENEVLSAENRIQAKYYAKIQKSVDETVKLRHDINNLVSVVEALVVEGDEASGKKAKELTKQLKNTTEKTSIPAVCENRLVNLILYDKLTPAAEKNILVTYNIILRDNCGIDDIDLCRVFVNLIDNSVSALTDYRGENKSLIISCRESDGMIYIKIINKTNPIENKTKEKGRGNGLKILKDISEKYNGEVATDLNGEDFSVIVSLSTNL